MPSDHPRRRSTDRPWADLTWRERMNSWAPLKVHVVMYSLLFAGFILLAVIYAHDHGKLEKALRDNEHQSEILAEALKAVATNRYEVDLQACFNGQDRSRTVLIVTRGLSDLLTSILRPVTGSPPDTPPQAQIRRAFRRVQVQLDRSQVRLIAEIKKDCAKIVRRPNGQEKELDDLIERQHRSAAEPGRTRTVTNSTTVTGPTTTGATRTVTGPTQTVAGPTRTETTTSGTETVTRTATAIVTVRPPATTETVTETVIGPSSTATTTVFVPVLPPPTISDPPQTPTATSP